MSDNSTAYLSTSSVPVASSPPPVVDANGNYTKGYCPNADSLNSIYKDGLISKEDCVQRCVTSIDECNDALNKNVSRIQSCNYFVCDKPKSLPPTTFTPIKPHNDQCKAGQYCKECCIGKCLVDDQTLNMTCFLKCIDDVCTEKVSVPLTSTGVGNPSPTNTSPDILIPISIPVEVTPPSMQKSDSGIWIFLVVIIGLALLGLGIFTMRTKNFQKKFSRSFSRSK